MHNNTLKPVVMIASAIYRFLNNTHVCDDNSIVSTDCLCDSVSFFIEKTNLVRTRQCLVYTFSTIRERISTCAITTSSPTNTNGTYYFLLPMVQKKAIFNNKKKHVYCCLEPNPISAVWTANSKRATDSHSRLAWFNTPLSWIKELWISWILANYRL